MVDSISTPSKRLRPKSTGDMSTDSWLPRPLERLYKYVVPTDSSYQLINTEDSSEDNFRWRGCSRNMFYGILLGALIIGGASSGWYFNQRAGKGEFVKTNGTLTH
jgi:hypothetical protein